MAGFDRSNPYYDTPVLGGVYSFFNPPSSASGYAPNTPWQPYSGGSLADSLNTTSSMADLFGNLSGAEQTPWSTEHANETVNYGSGSNDSRPAAVAVDPTRGGRFIPLPGGAFYDSELGKEVGGNLEKLLGGRSGGGGGADVVGAANAKGAWDLSAVNAKGQFDLEAAKQQIAGSEAVARINADKSLEAARIQANASMSASDKQVAIENLKIQAGRDASQASAQAQRYAAQLQLEGTMRKIQADQEIAAGNIALGMAQMQSAERINGAKMMLEREVAGLNAYTQVLGFESKERETKAQAAASVFKTLAEMAPGENLRSSWYILRGQAPPAPLTQNLPSGLLQALGLNTDTVNAAAKQMIGAPNPAPFMQQLMANQTTASKPAPALKAA